MTTQVLVISDFRAQFPEFSNVTTYPDATITNYWNMAGQYMSPDDGQAMAGTQLLFALYLMTAHLAKSFTMLNAGQTSVVVTGSSEGSVSVSLTPPPAKNAYQYWLSTTGYGIQLRALLSIAGASVAYIGGSLERASFRKAGGVF
jgi:hypothetical protein